MVSSISFNSTFLFLVFFSSSTFSARSTPLQNFPSTTMPNLYAEPMTRSDKWLGKPLIGDGGTIYACSGKFVYAFETNGSMAWNMHLNYTCNGTIAPVYGGKTKVYIVAENKVLRINSLSSGTPQPSVDIFFGNESAKEQSDEIIGLSASMLTSSVYINVKNKGLFSYTLSGRLRWSSTPVLNRFGYSQGCKKNVTDCFFTSVPVIDHCEASIYISNNQGELYSISARRPYFKWIQDFSSYDKVFTATPGNNGRLYVTIPNKAMVVGLDVLSGDVVWEKNIGPLSSAEQSPTVDSNGWMSIGSLDGFLYSISPTGVLKKFSKASPLESVVQVSPVLDCSGYAVYFSQTVMEGKSSRIVSDYMFVSAMRPRNIVFSLLVPATESFYWSETYPGQFASNLSRSDLHNFILDEDMVLAFIAAANIGNPLSCRSTRLKLGSCSEVRPKSVSVYTGNERAILLFLLFETVILIILAIVVRFCWIFWGKRKLQNQNLGKFLEKRRSLRLKKKEFDHTISELEQKASQEATTNDVLEKLSGLVQQREGIKRKLSTSYSLGRDHSTSLPPKSALPIYDGKARSYSFRGSKRESVTIFHTFSGTSSDDESSRETDSDEEILHREIELVAMAKAKGKAKVKEEPMEIVSTSSDEYDDVEDYYGSYSRTSSGSRRFLRPLHVEEKIVSTEDDREGLKTLKGSNTGRPWLKKRRSLSLTN